MAGEGLPARLARSAGAVFYVDAAHGNDANDGSSGAPWQTLAYAVATAPAGSTVRLRGDVVPPASIAADFNAGAPLTIEADGPRTVTALDLRWPRPTMTNEVGGPAAVLDVPYQGGAGTGPYWYWSQNYGGGSPAWTLGLRNDRDWILRLPGTPGHPDQAHTRREDSLNIMGGRNVMIVGGEVTVRGGAIMGNAGEPERRCIAIQDYTSGSGGGDAWGSLPVAGRIVHLEGIECNNDGGGSGDALVINAPKADVRVQNCRFVRMHSTQGVYTTLTSAVTLPITGSTAVTVADGSAFVAGAGALTTVGGTAVDLRYSGRSGNTFTVTSNYGGSGTLPVGTQVTQEVAPNGQAATHADYIQPYGGTNRLRVHNLTASGNMQGLQVRSEPGRPNGPAEFHNVNLAPFYDTDWNPAEAKYQIVMGPNDTYTFENVYLAPWPGDTSIRSRISPDGTAGNSDWPVFGTTPGPGDPGYSYVNAEDGAGTITFPGTRAGGPDNPNITGPVYKGAPPGGDYVPDGAAGATYDLAAGYTTTKGRLVGQLRFDGASYIRVRDLEIDGAGAGNAVVVWGASSWIELERCDVHGSTGSAVYVDGAANYFQAYATVARESATGRGLYLGGPGGAAVGCLTYRTGLAGIVVGARNDDGMVANCTVDSARADGVRVEADAQSAPSRVVVANVIASNCQGAGVGTVAGVSEPTGTVTGVVSWLNGGGATRLGAGFTATGVRPGNPGYAARAADDYRLTRNPMVVAQGAGAGAGASAAGKPALNLTAKGATAGYRPVAFGRPTIG